MLKNPILVLVVPSFAIPFFSKQNSSKKEISEMTGSYQPHEGG
jgi:hypothetical protein